MNIILCSNEGSIVGVNHRLPVARDFLVISLFVHIHAFLVCLLGLLDMNLTYSQLTL